MLREGLPDFSEIGKHKFRFEYDSASYQLESEVYQPKSIQTIKLVEANLDYNFKFIDRSGLQNLLDQSQADEIIIVKNGLVTDSSYSNLAFFDGSGWWTPERPLLAGIRRASLLDRGKIKTIKIRIDDLLKYEKVSLVNAMLDLDELTISTKAIFQGR